MPDFIEDSIGNWVSDFCHSDAIKLFPGPVAETSQSILETLLRSACNLRKTAPADLTEEDCKHGLLTGVASLKLSEECRGFVPSLCRAFFEDMQKRGRTGSGLTIGRYLGALKQAYLDASSPSAATFTRPGSKIGRNDPCPCGSGRKYKKCCGRDA